MGHYRSEMGYENEDRLEEERRVRRRKESVAKIKTAISERGIEDVLAEWLEDEVLFRINYR